LLLFVLSALLHDGWSWIVICCHCYYYCYYYCWIIDWFTSTTIPLRPITSTIICPWRISMMCLLWRERSFLFSHVAKGASPTKIHSKSDRSIPPKGVARRRWNSRNVQHLHLSNNSFHWSDEEILWISRWLGPSEKETHRIKFFKNKKLIEMSLKWLDMWRLQSSNFIIWKQYALLS
jgi:hypothetical protein